MGGMGAGDVKFMAALGAAAAWPLAADLVLWAAVSGGVLVFALALKPADWREAWLAASSGGGQGLKIAFRSVASKRKERVPYALAMSAGFILCHFIPLVRGVLTQ
jgi:prepilin peptidase CpaA